MNDEPDCYIKRVYPSSSTSYTSCSTSADHALYKAKSEDPVGNYADITFTKCPSGGGPSTNVSYWVVTGVDAPSDPLLCMNFNEPPQSCGSLSCCRTTGTWYSSQDSKTVSTKLWPSASDINPSNEGQKKSIYIETGGGASPGDETKPIWYSAKSVMFEIVCD